MEILLLIVGFVFILYFITMSITAIIKKGKNLKFYIIGIAIGAIVAFVGYIQIPITSDSSSEGNKEAASSGAKTTEAQNITSDIGKNILKINFIDNGDNGCVLIQYGEKNILIDSGKKQSVKTIEKSLRAHSINRIYGIIITSGDETTMGCAAQIIKDYSVEDARFVDDSVKGNNHFNEVQSAIDINGGEFNKINSAYKMDEVSVTANCLKNGIKLNFQISKDESNLKTMTFVKDEFDKESDTKGIQHNVDADCDSEGNFNIAVSVYKK